MDPRFRSNYAIGQLAFDCALFGEHAIHLAFQHVGLNEALQTTSILETENILIRPPNPISLWSCIILSINLQYAF